MLFKAPVLSEDSHEETHEKKIDEQRECEVGNNKRWMSPCL